MQIYMTFILFLKNAARQILWNTIKKTQFYLMKNLIY